jgi:hypothetical protein
MPHRRVADADRRDGKSSQAEHVAGREPDIEDRVPGVTVSGAGWQRDAPLESGGYSRGRAGTCSITVHVTA